MAAFQGVLCLFLLEMGMTRRVLKDLTSAGSGFVFRPAGTESVCDAWDHRIHGYAYVTNNDFAPGTYVLFAVPAARRPISPSRPCNGLRSLRPRPDLAAGRRWV